MKKLVLVIIFLFTIQTLTAQKYDTIYKHSGKMLIGEVLKIKEYTIEYKLREERLEQTIGRFAVSKIKFSSGRLEFISTKIEIKNEDDYESVRIVENSELVVGLSNSYEITGVTNAISINSAGSANRRSLVRLKKQAAKMKAPFILITSDIDSRASGGSGANQGIKRGFAYTYDELEFETTDNKSSRYLFTDFFEIVQTSKVDKQRDIIMKKYKFSKNLDSEFGEAFGRNNIQTTNDITTQNNYTLYYYTGDFERNGNDKPIFQVLVVDNQTGNTVFKYSTKLRAGERSKVDIADLVNFIVESL